MAAKKKKVIEKTDGGVLSDAAKAVGTALGKLALKTGMVKFSAAASKRTNSTKRTSVPKTASSAKVRSARAKAKAKTIK
jgi:hypothetical protein